MIAVRADVEAQAAAADGALDAAFSTPPSASAGSAESAGSADNAKEASLRSVVAHRCATEMHDADVLACRVDRALEALDSVSDSMSDSVLDNSTLDALAHAVSDARARVRDGAPSLTIRFASCLRHARLTTEALSASVDRNDCAAVAFLLRWGTFCEASAWLPLFPASENPETPETVAILRLFLGDARIARTTEYADYREMLMQAVANGNAAFVDALFDACANHAGTPALRSNDVEAFCEMAFSRTCDSDRHESRVQVYATLLRKSDTSECRSLDIFPMHFERVVTRFGRLHLRVPFLKTAFAWWDVIQCMLDDTSGRFDRVFEEHAAALMTHTARFGVAALERVLNDRRAAAALAQVRARASVKEAMMGAASTGRTDALRVLMEHPHVAHHVHACPKILVDVFEHVVLLRGSTAHSTAVAVADVMLGAPQLDIAVITDSIARAAVKGRCHPDTLRFIVNHPRMTTARARVLAAATALSADAQGREHEVYDSALCLAALCET